MERDGGYTKENAIAYSDMMCARPGWNYSIYGDKEYVDHVLRYYQVLNTGGTYPANGMQIPLYIQTEYGNIPYGTGSIADCGCGPTAFAMVASYLTGSSITPVDAVAWCGNSYYKAGEGTYWSYFQAAASHFGCGKRHPDHGCQCGAAGVIRRPSGHLLPESRIIHVRGAFYRP